MKVSKYRATNDEANFGAPIIAQVSHGAHITFELVANKNDTFYMTRWPTGLPRHDDPPNVLRFPHGLIRFGETMEQCASRLVHDQLGMEVKSVKIVYLDSYVDEQNHWHIEPGCIVEVDGEPRLPDGASEIVTFGIDNVPAMTFWPKQDFIDLVKDYI